MSEKTQDRSLLTDYMRGIKTLNCKYTGFINSQLAQTDLTRSQCETLLWLYDRDNAQTDTEPLLKAFAVSRATMSQTLNELSKKGLIEYANPPDDKRSKRIALTDKAKETCARIVENADRLKCTLFCGVSAAEFKTSNKVLIKLITNIRKLEGVN